MQITSLGEHSDVLLVILSTVLTVLGVCVMVITQMAVHFFKEARSDIDRLFEARNKHDCRIATLEAQHALNHGRRRNDAK
ncbi:MAG TPA: hypothetical protein VLH56_13465 [Dissulfurispiraceae bacterium]|nr:hypothetical protein [Dissulfurispiraceae bacterium]